MKQLQALQTGRKGNSPCGPMALLQKDLVVTSNKAPSMSLCTELIPFPIFCRIGSPNRGDFKLYDVVAGYCSFTFSIQKYSHLLTWIHPVICSSESAAAPIFLATSIIFLFYTIEGLEDQAHHHYSL